jgi:hypothetical protein
LVFLVNFMEPFYKGFLFFSFLFQFCDVSKLVIIHMKI